MKNKHFISLVAALGAAILVSSLTGCKKENQSGGQGGDVSYFLSLSETEITLTTNEKKKTAELKATYTPANALILWSSSDETVVTVDNGVVTAVADGNATITARLVIPPDYFSPKALATCEVTVHTDYVENIVLPDNVTIAIGSTNRLLPQILPESAQETELLYEVIEGKESVTVDELGVLSLTSSAKVNDKAKVKVTALDEHRVSKTVNVTVVAEEIYPTDLTITGFQDEVAKNTEFFVAMQFTPGDANQKKYTLTSSNEAVATTREALTGFYVVAKSAGSATITVTWESKTSTTNKIVKNLIVHEGAPSIQFTTDLSELNKGLIIGTPFTLTATVSNLTNQEVEYTSSNESVAEVNKQTGVITPKARGEAYITATAKANKTIHKQTSSFRVYGVPAKLYLSTSVTNGYFVRYGTTKTLTVIVRDENNNASRQDLLSVSISQASGMNIGHSVSTTTSGNTITFEGKRTASSATKTLKGTVSLTVSGYSALNQYFDIYDCIYDEFDVKPYDGLIFGDTGVVTVQDGGFRGSGYFSGSLTGITTKCQAIIVHVGEHNATKQNLPTLAGLQLQTDRPKMHGYAVACKNAYTYSSANVDAQWWNASANTGDEVNASQHYTAHWSGGASDPKFLSTSSQNMSNYPYGYEISAAMKTYNSTASATWKIIPIYHIGQMTSTKPSYGTNSGWFLPTAYQWAFLFAMAGTSSNTKISDLNDRITRTTGGQAISTSDRFWTCQEDKDNMATKALVVTGDKNTPIETKNKKGAYANTRAFLAF